MLFRFTVATVDTLWEKDSGVWLIKPNEEACERGLRVNGCVYETFGISKRFLVKLQLLLIRAVPLDKPLIAKCFIHDVGCWCSIFPVIFLSICYIVSVCRALGQTHSLTSFGFSGSSCGLAKCVVVKRWHNVI